MEENPVRLSDILIDCADADRLAEFWGELLGCQAEGRQGPYVWLRVTHDLTLGFQRVAESKHGKNRVHFDVTVDDVSAASQRIVELGGSRVPGYETGGFLVMADPEGNEFCVVPNGPWKMDEHGRATYLDNVEDQRHG
jgi:predicted enzyme related to lactoylglutathione lyase